MIKKDQKAKLYQESLAALEKKLLELKTDQAKATLTIKRGQEKNTKSARIIRYQIALVGTIITQKRLETTNH